MSRVLIRIDVESKVQAGVICLERLDEKSVMEYRRYGVRKMVCTNMRYPFTMYLSNPAR